MERKVYSAWAFTENENELELEIPEESARKMNKLFDSEFKKLEEIHNRFEKGTETLRDLLEHCPHFCMEFKNKEKTVELDVVEMKYYKKLVNIVKKQDKVIDEMAEYIVELIKYNNPEEIRKTKEIKQHFRKEVEKWS